MKDEKFPAWLQRAAAVLLISAVILGGLLLALYLLPDSAVFPAIKSRADALVQDGSFETITIGVYVRLNRVILGLGIILLVLGTAGYLLIRRGVRLAAASLALGVLAVYVLLLLAALNLGFYRLVKMLNRSKGNAAICK